MPGLLDSVAWLNEIAPKLDPKLAKGGYVDYAEAPAPAGKSPTMRVLSFLPLVLIVIFLCLLRER